MATILILSAKLTTLGLFKIKVFKNIGHGVKISVHDVPAKFYHVMKFGSLRISMREVIITAIL